MSDEAMALSEAAWAQIRQVVHDEALNSRVAASFLPLFGPLPSDTQAVPLNSLGYFPKNSESQHLAVDDYTTMRLATLSVNVGLKNAQLADPELTSALLMLRRAANIVARLEDAIIFRGQEGVGKGPKSIDDTTTHIKPVYSVTGGGAYQGLFDFGLEQHVNIPDPGDGPMVFSKVVEAIQTIEKAGHYGPFACVMGDGLFNAVTRPIANSMVLPRDSILPFLDGPLLRSSAIPNDCAIVVSLQGAPVEIVVPSDISVRFLQTTTDAEHVFRVQQKFVLRVKETDAIVTIAP